MRPVNLVNLKVICVNCRQGFFSFVLVLSSPRLFLWVLLFSSLHKNQHFHGAIRRGAADEELLCGYASWGGRGEGGVLPTTVNTGKGPHQAERGAFFKLEAYERVGISRAKV